MEKLTLENYNEFCRELWNSQEQKKDIRHAILGISSEIGELQSAFKKHVGYGREIDKVNVLEECGDLCYFSLRLYDIISPNNKDILENMLQRKGEGTLEECEASTFAALKLSEKLYDILVIKQDFSSFSILNCLDSIAVLFSINIDILSLFGFDIQQAMRANIEKLVARNKGKKFNSKLVLDRDLEAERKILEENAKAE